MLAWPSCSGSSGRHASDPVAAFPGLRTIAHSQYCPTSLRGAVEILAGRIDYLDLGKVPDQLLIVTRRHIAPAISPMALSSW